MSPHTGILKSIQMKDERSSPRMDLLVSKNSGERMWKSRKSRGKVQLKGLEPEPVEPMKVTRPTKSPGCATDSSRKTLHL